MGKICESDPWRYLGVSINGDTPIAGWFIMKNPSINGWFGGTPISGNHHLGMQENICNKHDGNSQLGISNKPSVLGNIYLL